jgi:hypothetical protein
MGKSVDSVHGTVDRGDTSPPSTGGHCYVWELTRARPPAAPVPENSSQGQLRGRKGRRVNGGVTAGREAVEGRLTGGVRFGNGGDGGGAQQ